MTTIPWEKVAIALAHPIPVAVLRLLAVEPVLSPNEMAKRLEMPLGRVSYHVRLLVEKELIKLVDVQARRGALEHYYSLASRPTRKKKESDG